MFMNLATLLTFLFLSPFVGPHIHVLIDPGHGGIDSGATQKNVEEKHINLAIATKLQKELSNRGYHVLLTRDKDEALSDSSRHDEIKSRHRRDLVQRGEIGNHIHPDLFISIHVNAGKSNSKGGKVLYQGEGRSYLLAQILQRKLNEITETSGFQTLGKEFYILRQIKRPTVIVEVGYITNEEERERLLQEDYQHRLASGLADGIDEFYTLYPIR